MVFPEPPTESRENRGKRGSALNKGMPIYDQMSGPGMDPVRRPRKTPGSFRHGTPEKASLGLRLSKNFLRPLSSSSAQNRHPVWPNVT